MYLEKNQILVTLSEDKKKITVECGAFDKPMTFNSCPAEPIKDIGNAVKSYDEYTGLTQCIPEWKPSTCGYKGDGECIDCN